MKLSLGFSLTIFLTASFFSFLTPWTGLSALIPKKIGIRIVPALVHSLNFTSHKNLGFTHVTFLWVFGGSLKGHFVVMKGVRRALISSNSFSVNPPPTCPA